MPLGRRPGGKKEVIGFRLAASESAAEREKFRADARAVRRLSFGRCSRRRVDVDDKRGSVAFDHVGSNVTVLTSSTTNEFSAT